MLFSNWITITSYQVKAGFRSDRPSDWTGETEGMAISWALHDGVGSYPDAGSAQDAVIVVHVPLLIELRQQ